MKKIAIFVICIILLPLISSCKKENGATLEYQIDISFVSEKEFSCQLKLDYFEREYNMQNIKFCLYPNAYRKDSKILPISSENQTIAYFSGESYGQIDINKVLVNEEIISYEINGKDSNILTINRGVNKGEKVSVVIDFTTTLAKVNHRTGYGNNTINLCNFYPILLARDNGSFYECEYYPYGDPFYSENASYKASITLPSTYVVASSLSPTGVEIFDYTTKYSYKQNNVKDIAFILSNKFEVAKDTINNISVYYYYYNDSSPQNSLKTIKQAVEYFSKTYANYPYNEFVVCQSNFIYGGMEYPCLVYVDDNLSGSELYYTIVHETAHQWWYGLVGTNQTTSGYIDEGLTEYLTVDFFDNYKEYGINKEQTILKTDSAYKTALASLVNSGISIPKSMDRKLESYSCELEYVSVNYYKSLVMFSEIEKCVGEKSFKRFLQSLQKKYKYQNIDSKTLKKEIKKLSSKAGNIFDKYTCFV